MSLLSESPDFHLQGVFFFGPFARWDGCQCDAGVNEGAEVGGAEVVKCGGEALVEDDEAEVVVAFVGAGLEVLEVEEAPSAF